ncbi:MULTISPECIES: TasA family protein [unclassified Knoellia]|uniref:TasA family protein n=1 Tax=Knoellia altitudinis TaxID=3404795 RepID=UPI00362388BE
MSVSRTKKILVPLATLTVAGAIAVGSGATFTSTTGNTISAVTAGSLTHTNSKSNAAIFNLSNIKPGDTVIGSVTLTNTGTLPAKFSLTETLSANAFGEKVAGENYLKLAIHNVTTNTSVYSGNFGGLVDGTATTLGDFAAGAVNTYRFTVTLDTDAPNSQQGLSANATYRWDSVQGAATVTDQS